MNSFPIGGTSPEGTTTRVGVNEPKLDPSDKKVLCATICFCDSTPNVGADGRSLKQACVDNRLTELDGVFIAHGGRSPYRPEVSYDMTKTPPIPILSRDGMTKHGWIPGWIKKYWTEDPDHPPFKAGTGMIRRPDVVILMNPREAPTQDNIKMVVEMKFPPDDYNPKQMADYGRIAGSAGKVEIMRPEDCDCDQLEEETRVPYEELDGILDKIGELMWLFSRGKIPRLPRIPKLPKPSPSPVY